MRRSLSILAAAAVVAGASAVSLTPAQAATPRPIQLVAEQKPMVDLITHRRWHDGEFHGWRNDEDYRPRNRHRRRHARRHRDRDFYPFYFGFPFAFTPHYYPYRRGHNCFRTWDGYLVCR
jgi:hypothetical protein